MTKMGERCNAELRIGKFKVRCRLHKSHTERSHSRRPKLHMSQLRRYLPNPAGKKKLQVAVFRWSV
jgi:hypothetical protein